MAQGPGSTRQNNGPFTVGGFYNFSPFTLVDGQACALQFDVNGNLKVTSTGGGGGSNPAAGPTGAPVPADADYLGINIAGTLFGVTGFNLPDSVPIAVAIVNANGDQITSFGGGIQYVDGTAELAGTFTGTVAFGYNGTDVVGLRMDASDNLLVNLNTPIPAGTNLIGQIEVSDGTNVLFTNTHAGYVQFPSAQAVTLASTTITGTVSVTQGTSPWVVAGAQTPADSYTNPTDAQDVFALLGGWDAANAKWQRVQVDTGTGTLKVDIGSNGIVAVTGTVGVTQGTTPWVVAGNLTHNNAAPAATSNVGVLPAVASAAAPTYNTTDQVLLSTDLAGSLRVTGTYQRAASVGFNPTFGIPALAVASGGTWQALNLSAAGDLITCGGGIADSGFIWDSSTAIGNTQTLIAQNANGEFYTGLVVGVNTTVGDGSENGGSFIIECSPDGNVWVPVTALILGTQQIISWPYVPAPNAVVQLSINIVANYWVRARLVSAINSGGISIVTNIVAQDTPVMPVIVAGNIPVTQVINPATNTTIPWVVKDSSNSSEMLQRLLVLTECIRRAVVALACDGAHNNPNDFDPVEIDQESGTDTYVVA